MNFVLTKFETNLFFNFVQLLERGDPRYTYMFIVYVQLCICIRFCKVVVQVDLAQGTMGHLQAIIQLCTLLAY